MFCVVCNELCATSTPTCGIGHTTCDECLCGLVRATLSADNVRAARGLVNCPWRGALGRGTAEVCTAKPWTLEQLAPRLDSATTGAVAGAAIAAVAVAHDEATRLRAELANAGATTGGAGGLAGDVPDEGRAERLQRWRQRFIESILTLKCPRCTTAFTDYDGCDSLTCANRNCGAFFCALCLEPFNNSGECHDHVSNSRHHSDGFVGLHGGQERFRRFHAKRRRNLIDSRVAGIPEDETFRNELRLLLLHDAELEGDDDGDQRGGGGGEGDGGNDGGGNPAVNLLDLLAQILGDRANQRHPIVKGVQALIDLAPLAAGAYAAFTGNVGRGAPPAAVPPAAAAQRRRGPSSVFVAAGAGAVIAGSIAAALSAYSAIDGVGDAARGGGATANAVDAAAAGGGGGGGTHADHPDAVALSLALGRPLSLDELQLSPEELREMRRAMLD